MNTLSLVDQTIEIRNAEESTGIKFDQVWCVFDLDDFPKENFDQAIERAKKEKFHVAYSNEAFELYSDPICQDNFSSCLRWSACRVEQACQPGGNVT